MTASSPRDITQMVIDWANADRGAFEKLIPVVYTELRRQAARHLRREIFGHTLQTTDLVNEGKSQVGGSKEHAVAKPRPILCTYGAVNAPHVDHAPATPSSQAWRLRHYADAG